MNPTSAGRRRSLRRAALIGLIIGLIIPLPTLFFALVSPIGETLLPVLVPGSVLLRPVASAMAAWPGAVNVLLTSAVNGLLFAVVFGVISMLIPHRR